MRVCDIEAGKVYRLLKSPSYGYIKVVCVLKPKQVLYRTDSNGMTCVEENKNNKIIVRAIHSTNKNFDFGIVRDFMPREIIKENS